MTFRGHIKNGNICLDEPVALPEGAAVNVEVLQSGDQVPTPFPDRRALLRLPVAARRAILRQQSDHIASLYDSDPNRMEWQGGDIVE